MMVKKTSLLVISFITLAVCWDYRTPDADKISFDLTDLTKVPSDSDWDYQVKNVLFKRRTTTYRSRTTRKKQKRTNITIEQTNELKKLFNMNGYPSKITQQNLSEHIGLEYKVIKKWFQNHRNRLRTKFYSLQHIRQRAPS